ncbi:hypothetical protein F2P81_011528 [Scophthalmus maximus]|uniref:Uncharacterized protein n=1 Tax=Scophthalmus maximus TaxID=52904 RepID=A0A6A4SLW6_SCOMX|nr:hypothetical protein F2P81_011528 [Scophthalmus maximus]
MFTTVHAAKPNLSSARLILNNLLCPGPRQCNINTDSPKKKGPSDPTYHPECPPHLSTLGMQSSLDSGTPPQFGCDKGAVRSTLRTHAFWLAALHIKQAGLSHSAQAAATKSESPALSTRSILAL